MKIDKSYFGVRRESNRCGAVLDRMPVHGLLERNSKVLWLCYN